MQTNIKHTLLAAATIAVLFSSCKKADPDPKKEEEIGSLASGVFISCEGKFVGGTGSISFFDGLTGQLYNDMFFKANGYPLGNVVQSVTIHNGRAFIPVNNANKLEIVKASDFKALATISGFDLPRYFLGIDNNKGYLSQWGLFGSAGSIKVIDIATSSVSATINTGKGAERMLLHNSNVYVACAGGFDADSVVMVINTTTNTVIDTITVGPNPASMQIDANGKLWVLCIGKWKSDYSALEQTGRLVRVDLTTNTVELSLPFSSTYSQPANLVINAAKNTLLYAYSSAVYTHNINSSTLNSTAYINRSVYGLGMDPLNDYIYVTDPGTYSSGGYVIRYDGAGSKIDSFQVDIGPGNFFFQ